MGRVVESTLNTSPYDYKSSNTAYKLANAFKNPGIRKDEAVALMMTNKPQFVCIWLGLSKISYNR